MKDLFNTAMFLLLASMACFGQTSFQGLTPGKSTRTDVERVLGQPVKTVSGTLIEYKEPEDFGRPEGFDKVWIQYRDTSSAAIVERIEVVCDYPRKEVRPDGCSDYGSIVGRKARPGRLHAQLVEQEKSGLVRATRYYGSPAFRVNTSRKEGEETVQVRVGLYSAALYDSVVPKTCTGTILGVWETNRGRLTISEVPGILDLSSNIPDTKGTYSTNNGTVIGFDRATFSGEWKDATGSGTFELKPSPAQNPFTISPITSFTGTWERTSGKGPKKGTWEGRCVETESAEKTSYRGHK